jgi:hypothetical protein
MTSTMHTYSRSILPAGKAPSIYTVDHCLAELGIDHQFLTIIDTVTVTLLIFKAIIRQSSFQAIILKRSFYDLVFCRFPYRYFDFVEPKTKPEKDDSTKPPLRSIV